MLLLGPGYMFLPYHVVTFLVLLLLSLLALRLLLLFRLLFTTPVKFKRLRAAATFGAFAFRVGRRRLGPAMLYYYAIYLLAYRPNLVSLGNKFNMLFIGGFDCF